MTSTTVSADETRPDDRLVGGNERLIQRSRERLARLLTSEPAMARAALSDDAIEAIRSCPTTIASVAKAFECYAERVCFGEPVRGGFGTLTYAEVWKRIEAFASGLEAEGIASL